MKRKDLVLVALLCFFSSLLGTFVMMKSSELGKAYAKQESVNRESEIVNRKVGAIVPSTTGISTRAKTEAKSVPITESRPVPTWNKSGAPKTEKKNPGNIILDPGAGYVVIGADNDPPVNDGKLKLHAEQGTVEGDDKHVIIQPHDAMTGNTEYTLPAAYATANDQVLTSTIAGALSWTTKGGGTDWSTMTQVIKKGSTAENLYTDVFTTYSGSGYLLGIHQFNAEPDRSGYLKVIIDGTAIFTSEFCTDTQGISLPFCCRFETSLQIQHHKGGGGEVVTYVSYVKD